MNLLSSLLIPCKIFIRLQQRLEVLENERKFREKEEQEAKEKVRVF